MTTDTAQETNTIAAESESIDYEYYDARARCLRSRFIWSLVSRIYPDKKSSCLNKH
ncbi:MAG: hypothetical protein V7739_15250 [Motiliproteus sp.]